MHFETNFAIYVLGRQRYCKMNVTQHWNSWGWFVFLIVSNLAAGLLFEPILLGGIVICFVCCFGYLIKETIVEGKNAFPNCP